MSVHQVSKGLDIPISGEPALDVEVAPQVTRVALLGNDYHGMKPTILVQPGDTVRRGQPVLEDKKTPGVMFAAPAAGTVRAVNRGDRRAFQSLVVDLDQREIKGSDDPDLFHAFSAYTGKDMGQMTGAEIRALMVESGLWTALRTRPFSKVPTPDTTPAALFVNAMDTNPLAAPVATVLAGHEGDLYAGLEALRKLSASPIYFCKAPELDIVPPRSLGIHVEAFDGPHPAGTVGLHMHELEGASRSHVLWHISYVDVIALGSLLRTGRLDVARTISLAGPGVVRPRLIRTRIGASLDELTAGELAEGEMRIVSGSVLSGRAAAGDVHGYLGRYHQQITVLAEGREREFLGWLTPGMQRFSTLNIYLGKLFSPEQKLPFTTTTNGSPRAMVPIGLYERVMPLDILPTFLLRSLIVNDIERAEELGCLELDEEDLALCTFVCPGKYDYGPLLRRNLDMIEAEG